MEKTVIFNVRLGRIMRKIELRETQTLDKLHEAIIYTSLGWCDPHAYSFFLDGIAYSRDSRMEYTCDLESVDKKEGPFSSDVMLKTLRLMKGQKISFVFDFGDDHRFNITVDDFGEIQSGKDYPAILEKKGMAPEQYPEEECDEM